MVECMIMLLSIGWIIVDWGFMNDGISRCWMNRCVIVILVLVSASVMGVLVLVLLDLKV